MSKLVGGHLFRERLLAVIPHVANGEASVAPPPQDRVHVALADAERLGDSPERPVDARVRAEAAVPQDYNPSRDVPAHVLCLASQSYRAAIASNHLRN